MIRIFEQGDNCKHHLCLEYHDKNYHKCELMGVSNSESTDIRVKKVCDKHNFLIKL